MQNEPRKIVDRFVASHLRSKFAELGFEPKGNFTFARTSGELLHVIHVQSSPARRGGAARLTLNLNVVVPEVHRLWTDRPLPESLEAAVWTCLRRMGDVLPDAQDGWWEITVEPDQAETANEVLQAIESEGLSFFEAYRSSDDLLSELESEGTLPGREGPQAKLVWAMLSYRKGTAEQAQRLLNEILMTERAPGFVNVVHRVAAALDIALDQPGQSFEV